MHTKRSDQSKSHIWFLQGSPFIVRAFPLWMPLIFQPVVTFVFSFHISPTWLGKVAGTQIHPIKNALSNSLQSIIHWVLLQIHGQLHWTTQSEHIAYIWPEIWEWEDWTQVFGEKYCSSYNIVFVITLVMGFFVLFVFLWYSDGFRWWYVYPVKTFK